MHEDKNVNKLSFLCLFLCKFIISMFEMKAKEKLYDLYFLPLRFHFQKTIFKIYSV